MKKFLPVLIAVLLINSSGFSQKSGTEQIIDKTKDATHILKVSNNNITIVKGTTYSFTVDSPEDQGPVSTSPTVQQLIEQLQPKAGTRVRFNLLNASGVKKDSGIVENGDKLSVEWLSSKKSAMYSITTVASAVSGRLTLDRGSITANTSKDLTLFFTAGQRSPNATVKINFPAGIKVTMDNTTVNVIGRGEVKLKDLSTQSIGRVGTKYSYSKVGTVKISTSAGGGSVITINHLDLRPANGADLTIRINNVKLTKAGKYQFSSSYSTTQPEILHSPGTGPESASLMVTQNISDFERIVDKSLHYLETPSMYTSSSFKWSPLVNGKSFQLLQSVDKGKTWKPANGSFDKNKTMVTISGLQPNQYYSFRLQVNDGSHKGLSNIAQFYSGKLDVKKFGIAGEDNVDYTDKINEAIEHVHQLGGGTLVFTKGIYSVRTVHLKSNVYLYVEKGASIKGLKGQDAPESTWFSDKKYRSGTSPTDPGFTISSELCFE